MNLYMQDIKSLGWTDGWMVVWQCQLLLMDVWMDGLCHVSFRRLNFHIFSGEHKNVKALNE